MGDASASIPSMIPLVVTVPFFSDLAWAPVWQDLTIIVGQLCGLLVVRMMFK